MGWGSLEGGVYSIYAMAMATAPVGGVPLQIPRYIYATCNWGFERQKQGKAKGNIATGMGEKTSGLAQRKYD